MPLTKEDETWLGIALLIVFAAAAYLIVPLLLAMPDSQVEASLPGARICGPSDTEITPQDGDEVILKYSAKRQCFEFVLKTR